MSIRPETRHSAAVDDKILFQPFHIPQIFSESLQTLNEGERNNCGELPFGAIKPLIEFQGKEENFCCGV